MKASTEAAMETRKMVSSLPSFVRTKKAMTRPNTLPMLITM